MKRIFKRIWEISRGEDNCRFKRNSDSCRPPSTAPHHPHATPAPPPQEGRKRDVLSSEVGQGGLRMAQESVDKTSLGNWLSTAGA